LDEGRDAAALFVLRRAGSWRFGRCAACNACRPLDRTCGAAVTITYPRAFPTHKNYRDITITQRKVVGVNTAPGSLVGQSYEWPGERWEAQISLPLMSRADGDAWEAWLTSLRGPVGSFLLPVPGATPRGAAAATPGTPQADGAASARARTLAIKTGLGVVANYLRAGDWLSIGTGSSRRLHRVLVDASLDSSGKATLDIWPALREALTNSATLYVSSATGKFMLLNSSHDLKVDVAGRYQPAVISCVEDLRP